MVSGRGQPSSRQVGVERMQQRLLLTMARTQRATTRCWSSECEASAQKYQLVLSGYFFTDTLREITVIVCVHEDVSRSAV